MVVLAVVCGLLGACMFCVFGVVLLFFRVLCVYALVFRHRMGKGPEGVVPRVGAGLVSICKYLENETIYLKTCCYLFFVVMFLRLVMCWWLGLVVFEFYVAIAFGFVVFGFPGCRSSNLISSLEPKRSAVWLGTKFKR